MDLTILATDRGSVPMNIGAVLVFDTAGGPSLAVVRALLSERVPTISRLRQRLRRVPFGCGRPVWVDDPHFVLDWHVIERRWPTPGGDRQLLDVAAELVCERLDPDRPLWRACFVTDPVGGQAALILVLHHVLADGLGGLAILAALADPGLPAPTRTFPQRPPQWRELAVHAAREKMRAAATPHQAVPRPGRPTRTRAAPKSTPPDRKDVAEPPHLKAPTARHRNRAAGRHRHCRSSRGRHRQRRGARRNYRGSHHRAPRSWRASRTAGGISAGVGTAIRDHGPARQQHRGPAHRRSDTRRRQRPTRRDHLPDPDKP